MTRATTSLVALLLAACSGEPRDGQPVQALWLDSYLGCVEVDWPAVDGRLPTRLSWRSVPDGNTTTREQQPPFVIEGLQPGELLEVSLGAGAPGLPLRRWIRVASEPTTPYFPAWFLAPPLRELSFAYDQASSPEQNGERLRDSLGGLLPGDRIVLAAGRYVIDSLFDLSLHGSATAPIRIEGAARGSVVITRSDALQNVINLGLEGGSSYLALRNLEITGGDIGLRLHDCREIWIDRCRVHATAQNAVAANSHPTEYLYFTRNVVHDTAGDGEGFYIGGNEGQPVAHHCVIAQNWVHHTRGRQGDGIEVKQGSWANTIAENLVHDTAYPAILVYGTDGRPPNVIERNICWSAGDHVLQVQGDAIVRNNFAAGGRSALRVGDHQGRSSRLVVTHNTLVNAGPAAELEDCADRPGIVFANNALYAGAGTSLSFAGGSRGVRLEGNIVLGPVQGTSAGFLRGRGTSDFLDVALDGTRRDCRPHPSGALIGAARGPYSAAVDLLGRPRRAPFETGAVEAW